MISQIVQWLRANRISLNASKREIILSVQKLKQLQSILILE